MWYALIGSLSLFTLAGAVYLVFRFHKFSLIQKLSKRSKPLSWAAALLPVILIGCFYFVNLTTLIVVMLHLVVGFAVCGLVGYVVGRIRKKKVSRDLTGIAAVALTVVYLGIGWFSAYHIFETDYTFYTQKAVDGELRIAVIADSHLGITIDGKRFGRQLKRIESEEPDLLVIAGDFVDDDSKSEDMIEACRALGEFRSELGVYFIYGNHDNGYFDYRNFSGQELRSELEKNGVVILEDSGVDLGGGYFLLGRNDRSMPGRASMDVLTNGIDRSEYVILLDHQPNDYAAEAEAGVDLVISGHTHGGHIFPAGQIGLLTGANDRRYGTEVRDNTTFVVTSGVSGWAIPFKTGTFSEYVIIDVKPEK